MTLLFPSKSDALAALCRRHHIRRMSLFGSVLKGTAHPDSDVDLLVEFEPDAAPSLLDLAAIALSPAETAGAELARAELL